MFFNYAATDLCYLKYLRKFLKKSSEAILSFDKFDLDSNLNTTTSNQVQIFTELDIYFEETRIERNEFDKIVKVIKMRDAKFVVIKKFSPRVNKKRRDENNSA